MNHKEISDVLVAQGAKRIKGLKVKKVTLTEFDEYTRVTLTVDDDKIPCHIENKKTGVFEESKNNLVYTSKFAISSVFKDDDDLCVVADEIVERAKTVVVLLSGATIDVISQLVPADTAYINPYSTKTAALETKFEHDVYITYVENIKLSDKGMERLDKLIDKMLGF